MYLWTKLDFPIYPTFFLDENPRSTEDWPRDPKSRKSVAERPLFLVNINDEVDEDNR
jgi:hypothetical protein